MMERGMEKVKPCRQWNLFLGEMGIIFTLIWPENVTLVYLQFCMA